MAASERRARSSRRSDDKQTPVKHRGFFWAILGFIVGLVRLIFATTLFFAILVYASYIVIGWYIRGNEIPAPELVGHSVTEALANMKRANLSMIMDHEEPSDAVAQGEIISQDPLPKSLIKTRSPIRVVVSSGPKHYSLPPDLLTLKSREAGIRLREMGLEVGNVAYISLPGQPNDTLLATDPPIGTGVPPGGSVNLLVAVDSPEQQVTVPNLQSMTVDLARSRLEALGLRLGEINEKASEGVPPGTIYSQSPGPGTPVSSGFGVSITVAPTS